MDDSTPLKLFLHYPEASRSSRRVAEGRGDLARRVQEAASERSLPLGENLDLVQLCARVDFGERLEGKLLEVIAETVGWLRAAGKSVVEEPTPEEAQP
jgi:type III secretion system FlhB-like substrate exporter